MINDNFWRDRRVFLTGHTGFKGGWLATWLCELGAVVTGYALPPDTNPSYFEQCAIQSHISSVLGDIRDYSALEGAMRSAQPEVVFHLAAQSLVRRSYRMPLETFAVNVMGTAHVLEAVRGLPFVRAVLIVTSDKCYENNGRGRPFIEGDPLGGHDPYAASKACAELVTTAYRRSFSRDRIGDLAIASARAGNVIGGGDWTQDRIVPDAIRAWIAGQQLVVRNPASVRPWQHVMDPLSGYIALAERLCTEGPNWEGAWNFGPDASHEWSVASLVDEMTRTFGDGTWRHVASPTDPHEAVWLGLNSGKANRLLQWTTRIGVSDAIRMTVDWYREALSKERGDCYHLAAAQVHQYRALNPATQSAAVPET